MQSLVYLLDFLCNKKVPKGILMNRDAKMTNSQTKKFSIQIKKGHNNIIYNKLNEKL